VRPGSSFASCFTYPARCHLVPDRGGLPRVFRPVAIHELRSCEVPRRPAAMSDHERSSAQLRPCCESGDAAACSSEVRVGSFPFFRDQAIVSHEPPERPTAPGRGLLPLGCGPTGLGDDAVERPPAGPRPPDPLDAAVLCFACPKKRTRSAAAGPIGTPLPASSRVKPGRVALLAAPCSSTSPGLLPGRKGSRAENSAAARSRDLTSERLPPRQDGLSCSPIGIQA